MGSKESKPSVDEVFSHLDENKDGSVSTGELEEWIADEAFAGNPDLKTAMPLISKLVDLAESSDKESQLTRAQIEQYFSKLTDEEVVKMTRSMSTSMTSARVRMLKSVYGALDLDENGTVTRQELADWLQKHDILFSYKHLTNEALIKKLLPSSVDKNAKLSFSDFKDVFKEWPVRSIRKASEQLRKDKHDRDEAKKPRKEIGFDL